MRNDTSRAFLVFAAILAATAWLAYAGPATVTTTAVHEAPAAAAVPAESPPPEAASPAEYARAEVVRVRAGTLLRVRLANGVGSDRSSVEDAVRGTLTRDLVVGGRVVMPAGSEVSGVVVGARRSGRVEGRARLALRFTAILHRDTGELHRISTHTWVRVAPGTKKKDAAKIAVPSGIGAVVGGIVGGGKGAAVGAAAGGAGGTAVVLSTRGEEVRLPRGSVVAVRLSEPTEVTIDTAR